MTKHRKHQQKRDINPSRVQLEELQERQRATQQKKLEMVHDLGLIGKAPAPMANEILPMPSVAGNDSEEKQPLIDTKNPMVFLQTEIMRLVETQIAFNMSVLSIWATMLMPPRITGGYKQAEA